MEIKDKAALVSGGGSGIGRAAVLALVERGANVVVADVDELGGQRSVELAAGLAGSAVFSRCDVTSREQLAGTFALVEDEFGCWTSRSTTPGSVVRTCSRTIRGTGSGSSTSI